METVFFTISIKFLVKIREIDKPLDGFEYAAVGLLDDGEAGLLTSTQLLFQLKLVEF